MLKEEVSMFMSDLFDKAVSEGARPNTVKTRSQPNDET